MKQEQHLTNACKWDKDRRHAKAVKQILFSHYGKSVLYQDKGYYLYKWILNRMGNLDWKVRNFWVVKKDYQGRHRGDKIFNKSEMRNFVANGGKVRPIQTYCKDTRKELRGLMQVFDIPVPNQVGFTAGKNIFSVAEDFKDEKATLLVDLEDAFNQITQNQVYLILREVFDLNEKDSKRFARVMCVNGCLFQGNPLAPLIFNIWSSRLVHVMTLCGLNFKQYADDITIVSKYDSISYSFMRFICGLITQLGFKVNRDKLERQRKTRTRTLGLDRRKVRIYGLYPQRVRKLKAKIKYLVFLFEKRDIRFTNHLTKDGKPLRLSWVIAGLHNWLRECKEHSETFGLDDYHIKAIPNCIIQDLYVK